MSEDPELELPPVCEECVKLCNTASNLALDVAEWQDRYDALKEEHDNLLKLYEDMSMTLRRVREENDAFKIKT